MLQNLSSSSSSPRSLLGKTRFSEYSAGGNSSAAANQINDSDVNMRDRSGSGAAGGQPLSHQTTTTAVMAMGTTTTTTTTAPAPSGPAGHVHVWSAAGTGSGTGSTNATATGGPPPSSKPATGLLGGPPVAVSTVAQQQHPGPSSSANAAGLTPAGGPLVAPSPVQPLGVGGGVGFGGSLLSSSTASHAPQSEPRHTSETAPSAGPVWPSLMQRFPPSSAKEWLALARNTRIMNSRSVQKYLRKRRMFDGGSSSATTVGVGVGGAAALPMATSSSSATGVSGASTAPTGVLHVSNPAISASSASASTATSLSYPTSALFPMAREFLSPGSGSMSPSPAFVGAVGGGGAPGSNLSSNHVTTSAAGVNLTSSTTTASSKPSGWKKHLAGKRMSPNLGPAAAHADNCSNLMEDTAVGAAAASSSTPGGPDRERESGGPACGSTSGPPAGAFHLPLTCHGDPDHIGGPASGAFFGGGAGTAAPAAPPSSNLVNAATKKVFGPRDREPAATLVGGQQAALAAAGPSTPNHTSTSKAPAASAPAASAPPHHHRNIFGPLIHLKHRFFLEDSMFRLLDRRGTNSESDSGYEAGYETDADESDALSDFFSGAASSRNISGGVGAGPYGQMNRISRKRKIDALVNLTMRMSLQKCHQQSGRSGSGGGAINRAAGAAGGGIVGVAAPGAGGENNDDDMGLVQRTAGGGSSAAGPGAGDHGGGSSLGGSYSGRSDGRSSPDHDQFTMMIGPGVGPEPPSKYLRVGAPPGTTDHTAHPHVVGTSAGSSSSSTLSGTSLLLNRNRNGNQQSGDHEAEDEYNESMVGQYYVPGRGYMDIEPIREEELPLRDEELGGGAGGTTRAEIKADENRSEENGNGNTHMEGQSDEENN